MYASPWVSVRWMYASDVRRCRPRGESTPGPRGTGFLYVRRTAFERFDPLMPDLRAADWTGPQTMRLHPDAQRYETWERRIAGDLGLGVAVRQLLAQGVESTWARIRQLATMFRAGLHSIPGVEVCDRGALLCGICTFRVGGHTALEVAEALHQQRIRVSVSQATSAQLDLGSRGIDAVVRASLHAYNTRAEVERVLGVVEQPRVPGRLDLAGVVAVATYDFVVLVFVAAVATTSLRYGSGPCRADV